MEIEEKKVIINQQIENNQSNMNHISLAVKKKILVDLIEPAYYEDVKSKLKTKKIWIGCGHIFETLSKIMIATAGCLSFASGFYNNKTLSFLSGSSSTVGLAFIQFSAYCFKESRDTYDDLNRILNHINIQNIPEYDMKINDKI
jgi:hypothetical protein